ncbi:MAG: bifunctional demethylmenaquinone methyltransferase/2-methoxy-6-polyprenyl-1,4-benzoquinol methylase UbiE [Gammaproteobacteria bacterium]|nr:bifunctional demethylmenaquinone methyltransferase/2-methoxy-6-polyprenyl-1,4-benzoquinol methylase UbiE [Gammaproteobacteria bacterium]
MENKTHFGFKQVDAEQKASMVRGVFDSVASKYDVMNDVMSFGVHRVWKALAIAQSGVRPGQQVLDLAGGTGDLTIKLAKKVGKTGKVVLSDINQSMLDQGRDRLIDAGIVGNVDIVQADAEQLPFEDNRFNLVTMAFGLRNVTRKENALKEIHRVLKPGGRVLVLEFSKPVIDPLSKAYDLYSFKVLPTMGKLVANDAESYQYLAESIRMHPDQETLAEMMREAGLENVSYQNMTGGIVALHKGFKYS